MRVSLAVNFLAAFFIFGAAMCLLTILMLALPGSALAELWRLNPEAQSGLIAVVLIRDSYSAAMTTARQYLGIVAALRLSLNSSSRAPSLAR